ncbi:insulinoma-associated protein 1 [Pseudonaja textilis]|uniref:insulinoma-associated protein 1 n=1 Tax=Pseudonaja textilis TaxID=8673 RepID=UPI000EA85E88|nr:insulinoma-associated protein 1 [Pseudonaja textilis]
MPRGFLVKRSRRPTPISYRTRCSCYPASGLEGGDPVQLLVPPPFPAPQFPSAASASESAEAALLPAPAVPQFGTPEGPSSPAPLHSPARAVSEERSLHLASPVSAESFPAPEPLLLGPGGELKLWAVAAAAAALASGPPPAPQRSHAPSPGASKRSQGRKAKAARKLHFEDEVTTSPVLGLRIKEGPPEPAPATQQLQLQQQPTTGSAAGLKAGSAQPLGEFICQLCKERYPDPLALAQHKCSRIVRVEYRCPECDKLFSCPANLASHRRWHKPRPVNGPATKAKPAPGETAKGGGGGGGNSSSSSSSSERDTPSPGSGGGGSSGEPEAAGAEEFACPRCAKRFRRQSALRKHLPLHHEPLDSLSQARPHPEACLEEAAAGHSSLSLSGECHLCPVCGETFPSKSGQERHLRVLHAAQAFPCKYCPATFYSSPGLTRHINKCHPSENRQVILLQVPVRPAC